MIKKQILFINCITSESHDFNSIQENVGVNYTFEECSDITEISEILNTETLNLLLVDKKGFNSFSSEIISFYRIKFIIIAPDSDISDDLLNYELIENIFKEFPSEKKMSFALIKAENDFRHRQKISHLQKQIYDNRRNLDELNKVGVSLSSEYDLDKLLDLILSKTIEIMEADAGSLYLVEKIEEDNLLYSGPAPKRLHFKITKNYSKPIAFTEFYMDITSKSISGSVALTGETINIENVNFLPKNATYTWNNSVDEETGYTTRSMLTIPMKNAKGEIIGILQLINKKENGRIKLVNDTDFDKYIKTFNDSDISLAHSLASQAAMALDNAKLYKNIFSLFEGFITALGTAIESRDPTTRGHSSRVALLSQELATAVDETREGPYAKTKFSEEQKKEIYYAGLLHDFGKIGIREEILQKAQKLFPEELDNINFRFEQLKNAIELQFARKKTDFLLTFGNKGAHEHLKNLDEEMQIKLNELDGYFDFILKANEPNFLEQKDLDIIQKIGQISYSNRGTSQGLISENEIRRLSIRKGTLSEDERVEIESHVQHSFDFLSKIRWTEDLSNIPNIVYSHHEKNDGTGYPRQIKGKENIPLAARIMVITDIYDALTASDRPYKKAIPIDKALSIIKEDSNNGKVDSDIFEIFISKEIYKCLDGIS